jgi:hypothetical protein
MASRNYAMAYDTPYNRKLLDVLSDYDMRSDTNGEPDIFHSRLSGGSLGEGLLHPHLPHFSRSPLPYRTLPIQGRRPMATAEMSGGLRPPGMVEPFIHSSPFYYIQPGNLASYPIYNAVEMRAVGGAVCADCNNMYGGKFGIGLIKDIGKDVLKGVAKEGAKEASKALVKGAKTALMSGEGRRPRGRPRKAVESMDMEGGKKFNFGKALKSVGKALKPVGKVALPILEDVGKIALKEGAKEGSKALVKSYMSGSGVDGRKRRAEIVKKVMKEQGLKMVDASKYVKQHGLY